MYYTLIQIFFSNTFNCFKHITHHLSTSWYKVTTNHLLLFFLAPPWDGDNQFTMRNLMTISTWHPTIAMIVDIAILNQMIGLYGEHPGTQMASGHPKHPSHQYLDNESWQLNYLLHQYNCYIICDVRLTVSQRARMNMSLCRWHPQM